MYAATVDADIECYGYVKQEGNLHVDPYPSIPLVKGINMLCWVGKAEFHFIS